VAALLGVLALVSWSALGPGGKDGKDGKESSK
jgi:hypothetical protein